MTNSHHSPAGSEVKDRVHAFAVAAAALDDGTWPASVEILDALGELIGSAARWAMVTELEAVAS